jgi:hypothetical protein
MHLSVKVKRLSVSQNVCVSRPQASAPDDAIWLIDSFFHRLAGIKNANLLYSQEYGGTAR